MFSFEGGQNVIGVNLNGQVVVLDNLDADGGTMVPVYTLNVTITDDGGMATSKTFTVTITDENDNLPMFLFDVYTIFVSEEIPVGTPVGWSNFYQGYFGRTEGPRFIVGSYAPSEEFKGLQPGSPFYSGLSLE